MANWPSIDTPNSIQETIKKKTLRSSSELGYAQTRSRWTGSKKAFELDWEEMLDADKNTLETFFDDNQGASFIWAHPVSGEHECVFSDDEISFQTVVLTPNNIVYAVTVNIEEVSANYGGEIITFGDGTLEF